MSEFESMADQEAKLLAQVRAAKYEGDFLLEAFLATITDEEEWLLIYKLAAVFRKHQPKAPWVRELVDHLLKRKGLGPLRLEEEDEE